MADWDKRLLHLAEVVSGWSKDPNTKVGAYIFDNKRRPLSFGYNGMPRLVDDTKEERNLRPTKRFFYEHAERNAIYNATTSLEGSTIYVTHYPCADCARAIIQKGIARVVVNSLNGPDSELANRYADSFAASAEMFNEAGVIVNFVNIKDDNE